MRKDGLKGKCVDPPVYGLAWVVLSLMPSLAEAQQFKEPPLPPLAIPSVPAGNFMELRSNHFHSGVDLKTNGATGVPVIAVSDGWVSRIKVSPWGYGLALYIDHAEGLTTVYGHLERYAEDIAEYVLEAQYKQRSFSVDLEVPRGELPVARGATIAWSGNTGGSSAPHLHYEVRRTRDQHALDPEAYGLDLPDSQAPIVRGIRVYPRDSASWASPYPGSAVGFPVTGSNGRYSLRPQDLITASGEVGFAVHTIDHYDGSPNTCGVRSLMLFVDEVEVFQVLLSEVDFAETRYANAHMDHGLFTSNSMHYHRCFRLPNDRSKLYQGASDGWLKVEPDRTYRVRVVISDANENTSTVEWVLQGAPAREGIDRRGGVTGSRFAWDRDNRFVQPGFRLHIPSGALYDDEAIRFARHTTRSPFLSERFEVLDATVPLHVAAEVSIQADQVPVGLLNKTVVVRSDVKGRSSPEGGRASDGWITASTKRFGSFALRVDTIPPKVMAVSLHSDMRGRSGFTFRVSDELSGLDEWEATLDGQWIVLVYDPRTKTLSHRFDRFSEGKGERRLVLEVRDERGNTTRVERTFLR
ncbi:MAG: M23 family metallopeptidase [Flavobacteriales bacterium]|nr:M23 family metallopeptidase [Flavobacteriales bacterium]